MAQYSTQAPVQGLVDLYQMTDGLPITESEIYNPEEPYENRDLDLNSLFYTWSTLEK